MKRKVKLTKKKADWVGNRNTTLRSSALKVNDISANRLAESSIKLVDKMHKDISKQIMDLFNTESAKESVPKKPKGITVENVAMDASIASKANKLMNALTKKWRKSFNIYSKTFSESMIKVVNNQSSKDLQAAAKKLSGGMTINTSSLSERTKDIISASVQESSSLIKSLESDYTDSVRQAIARSISSNTSSMAELRDLIHESLQSKYKVQRNKAKNTSLDQVRKAYSNIGASKMQSAGLDQYIWRHSGGGQSPNEYHRDILDGQVFSLSNPPVIDKKTKTRGKPADWYGCKCYMEPVITFGD